MAQLFQYAVLKDEKRDRDGEIIEKAQVVVDITAVLADDSDQAQLLAARAIPEEQLGDIDRLQVVVRPF